MMIRDPRRYSTIRREPAYKPADGYSMHAFYDSLTKPTAIVAILAGYFALINQDLRKYIDNAAQGDDQSIAHLLVLILSLLAGFRVIQSLYLAKRDYAHLEHGFFDVLIFLAVGAFASGAVMKLDDLVVVLSIYSVCTLLGTINFFGLYHGRIPVDSAEYDYPIERRIQAVNATVFACLTVLLMWAVVAARRGDFPALYWMLSACSALIIVNIIHSEQLTMLPKFLLFNEPDSPSSSIKIFRDIFGHMVALKSDEEIANALFDGSEPRFRSIKTIRAARGDVERICAELLRDFSYIFEYILDTRDSVRLRRTLCGLMKAAGGFGSLGYMSFYFIVDDEGREVGMVKLDTSHGNWLYQMAALAAFPFIVLAGLRRFNIFKVWQLARRALSTQSGPRRKELRLTYIVIFPAHRRQGYGESFVRLLCNASLNYTNDIIVDRITLFVREKNSVARQLFQSAGFACPKGGSADDSDPFADVKTIGRPLFMERLLSTPPPQQSADRPKASSERAAEGTPKAPLSRKRERGGKRRKLQGV